MPCINLVANEFECSVVVNMVSILAKILKFLLHASLTKEKLFIEGGLVKFLPFPSLTFPEIFRKHKENKKEFEKKKKIMGYKTSMPVGSDKEGHE